MLRLFFQKWEKNMDISQKQYKIVFTNDCIREMDYIYNYISSKLYAEKSSKELMKNVQEAIENLKNMPRIHMVIKKYNEVELEYRRIVIGNYIIIYTISEKENTIYIVHMYYGGSNYLNDI